jgi:hypothetical protein
MFNIYDGDFLLFTVDNREEAEYYEIEGYVVEAVNK